MKSVKITISGGRAERHSSLTLARVIRTYFEIERLHCIPHQHQGDTNYHLECGKHFLNEEFFAAEVHNPFIIRLKKIGRLRIASRIADLGQTTFLIFVKNRFFALMPFRGFLSWKSGNFY